MFQLKIKIDVLITLNARLPEIAEVCNMSGAHVQQVAYLHQLS